MNEQAKYRPFGVRAPVVAGQCLRYGPHAGPVMEIGMGKDEFYAAGAANDAGGWYHQHISSQAVGRLQIDAGALILLSRALLLPVPNWR